jgi:hypothetical protein
MARLTWQNVAAPSFEDALRATASAGQLFTQGFSGLGDVATGFRERAVRDNTADATAKLMQAAAAAGGGQAGRDAVNRILANGELGYKPQDLSSDFGTTVDTMLSNYLDREGTIASTDQTRAYTDESRNRVSVANQKLPYELTKLDLGNKTEAESLAQSKRMNPLLVEQQEFVNNGLRRTDQFGEAVQPFLVEKGVTEAQTNAIKAKTDNAVTNATQLTDRDRRITEADTQLTQAQTNSLTAQDNLSVAQNNSAALPDVEAERLASNADNRADSQRERAEAEERRKGEAFANELARSMMFTPTQLREEITQNSDLTPAGIEAALAFLQGVDPTVYTPSLDSTRAAAQSAPVVSAKTVVSGFRRAVEQAYDVDNVVRYYAEAKANDDGTTAQEFVKRYSDNPATADDANDAAALLDHIRTNYKNVPDALTKRVIEDSVRGRLGGVFFEDSRINDPRVKEILGVYSDNPIEVADKADRYVKLAGTFNTIEKDIADLEAEKALAIQRDDPAAVIAIDRRISVLQKEIMNMINSDEESSYGSMPDNAIPYLYGNRQETGSGSTTVTGRPTNGEPGNSSSRLNTR